MSIFAASHEDFNTSVIQLSHEKPVLVDLWAEWCSPCLVIAPLLETIDKEYEDAIAIAKVEVDEGENMKVAGHYKVRGFPTIILFHHGEEQGRFAGAKPLHFIREFIDQHA